MREVGAATHADVLAGVDQLSGALSLNELGAAAEADARLKA